MEPHARACARRLALELYARAPEAPASWRTALARRRFRIVHVLRLSRIRPAEVRRRIFRNLGTWRRGWPRCSRRSGCCWRTAGDRAAATAKELAAWHLASAYQREAQYEARRRAVAEAAEFELHHAARMAYPSSEGASAGSDALARLVRNGT